MGIPIVFEFGLEYDRETIESISRGECFFSFLSDLPSREIPGDLDITWDIYEDEDSESLYDRNLRSTRCSRREENRSIMTSWFSFCWDLNRESHLTSLVLGESDIPILYTDPVGEAVYIRSLLLRFDESRSPSIVTRDEVFFGRIERNRCIRIIGHLDDFGFGLTSFDGELVFERGDREARMCDGYERNKEQGSAQNARKFHRI